MQNVSSRISEESRWRTGTQGRGFRGGQHYSSYGMPTFVETSNYPLLSDSYSLSKILKFWLYFQMKTCLLNKKGDKVHTALIFLDLFGVRSLSYVKIHIDDYCFNLSSVLVEAMTSVELFGVNSCLTRYWLLDMMNH